MKWKFDFFIVVIGVLAQTGCVSPPTPSPRFAEPVSYAMSAALDGKPLPALVGIKAESCDDGYGGLTLTFTATADIEPQAIDDEISLGLNIKIDDIGKTAIGEPIEVGKNGNIQLSASLRAFIEGQQDPLTTATGMMTLSALSAREVSGSASLVFTDPDDVSLLVKDSLAYEVTFTNLAVIHYCPGG